MGVWEPACTLGTQTDHQRGGLVPGARRGQQRGGRCAQHQGSCRFGLVSSPGKVTSTRNALQTHGNAPLPVLFSTSTCVSLSTQETFPRRQRQGAEGPVVSEGREQRDGTEGTQVWGEHTGGSGGAEVGLREGQAPRWPGHHQPGAQGRGTASPTGQRCLFSLWKIPDPGPPFLPHDAHSRVSSS